MFILTNLHMSHKELLGRFSRKSFLFGKIRSRSALLRSVVAIVTNLLKRIAILHKHPYDRKAYYNPGDEEG